MKRSVVLLVINIAYLATPVHAKDKNPADYRLIVHVLTSSRETQLVYRGTDCTSSAYGEIDETDTLTARVYTTCSPNWAAYRYAFAELDVTNTDPTVNNTVRFLGQCANVSGAARASRILGGLGNAMAAAGGTPEQRTQAERRSSRSQPLPPSTKCDLAPGDYAARWEKGKLVVLLHQANGKYTTVGLVVSAVAQKQELPSAQATSGLLQDCPTGMTRVATSYGSFCKKQDESASAHAMFSSAPTEANPALTHNGFTDSDLTQDCPQGMTRIDTSYGSYCGAPGQIDSALSKPSPNSQQVSVRRVANQAETNCHSLILQLNETTARFDPSASNANMEQQIASMEQLQGWMKQLDECVLNAPAQLTTKDWQNAVFVSGELREEFYGTSAAIAREGGVDLLNTLSRSCSSNYQQWANDYNDLVRKYNGLVRDYNDQRDLIIRLIATPPPLPPARTFFHCSTFNFGSVGSIDCY